MVSSTVGSSTLTGCIRRSRAASFSMMRYSLSVVAPTSWSSPRARAGFRMFPASILPSPALPAPTISWISSINRITSWHWRISSMSFCMRSSNWPRIPVPWTRLTTSRRMTCLPWSFCGTLPSTIFWARPSTTAVLPTPGSPMRTGLFLVRRLRISMTRMISSSRPITGSMSPRRAMSVMLMPNSSRRPWGCWGACWRGPPGRSGPCVLPPFPRLPPSCVGGVLGRSPLEERKLFRSLKKSSKKLEPPVWLNWLRGFSGSDFMIL